MMLGYSAVKGDALRRRKAVGDFLDRECSRCDGGTAVVAQGGEKFSWVREQVCATPGSGGDMIFFGGGNDDFSWGARRGLIRDAIALLGFALDRPSPKEWSRLFHHGAEASRQVLPAQESSIAETLACAKARGSHFWFVHDFVAWDLESGRDEDRRAMLEARKSATERAGGSFIDLYDLVKDRAGVSWFNDFIHPSEIGHAELARQICARLSASSR
jgi:hypothetical protein